MVNREVSTVRQFDRMLKMVKQPIKHTRMTRPYISYKSLVDAVLQISSVKSKSLFYNPTFPLLKAVLYSPSFCSKNNIVQCLYFLGIFYLSCLQKNFNYIFMVGGIFGCQVNPEAVAAMMRCEGRHCKMVNKFYTHKITIRTLMNRQG